MTQTEFVDIYQRGIAEMTHKHIESERARHRMLGIPAEPVITTTDRVLIMRGADQHARAILAQEYTRDILDEDEANRVTSKIMNAIDLDCYFVHE